MIYPLKPQHELFEIPDEVTFLNCASMGPFPRAVREAGEQAVVRESKPWGISEVDFFSQTEKLRGLVAELIDGDADGVAIIPSVSYGTSLAAKNLPAAKGSHIITIEEQYPSNVYPWRELAKETGAEVKIVDRPANSDWTTAILDAITEKTSIVALAHNHWIDGSAIDLERVSAKCKQVGAALVIDATQSLGVKLFSVKRIQPDFLISATYKWLLGPYSFGVMWVAPEHREGQQIEHSWITREGVEDFSQLVHYTENFRPGARRYDVGQTSNFTLVPMAIAAMKQILAWDVKRIEVTLASLTDYIAEEASKIGLQTIPKQFRSAHIIGLRSETPFPADLATRLAAENVYVSIRGSSIRISPHLYNTKKDVDRFIAALSEIMSL